MFLKLLKSSMNDSVLNVATNKIYVYYRYVKMFLNVSYVSNPCVILVLVVMWWIENFDMTNGIIKLIGFLIYGVLIFIILIG